MPRKGLRSVFFHPSSPARNAGDRGAGDSTSAIHIFRATLMEDSIASAEKIIKRWDPEISNYAKITSIFHESRDEARRFIRAINDLHNAMLFFSNTDSSSGRSQSTVLVRAQGLMQTAMKRLEKEFYQILAANRDRLDSDSVSSARSSLCTLHSTPADTDDDDIFDGDSVASISVTDDDEACDDVVRRATKAETSSKGAVAAGQRLPPGVIASLRSIAQCMDSAGYGYECVEVYKRVRSSILHEGLARLGFDLSVAVPTNAGSACNSESSNLRRTSKAIPDNAFILDRRAAAWVAAAPSAVRTLFAGERFLSDFVFGTDGNSDCDASSKTNSTAAPIRESCFAVIAMDAAVRFLAFPELVAAGILKGISTGGAGSKRPIRPTPERVFGLLGMYNALANLWPEIDSVFSYSSTSNVEKQVLSSLLRLGEAVRAGLADLELAVQKESSKATVPGGGIHPLTQNIMNYVVCLADDYSTSLAEIYADYPFRPRTPIPQAFLSSLSSFPFSQRPTDLEDSLTSPACPSSPSIAASPCFPVYSINVSARLAWLLLALLCKLDVKAERYKDSALSYLFLANNLRYVLTRVRGSKQLRYILGREWDANHEHKARAFFRAFERLAWSRVIDAIPTDAGTFILETEGVAGARDRVKQFNRAFEEAYRKQAGWSVLDCEMRQAVRESVAAKVIEPYRRFYENCRPLMQGDRESFGVVRFAPEDVANCLSALYDDKNHEINSDDSGSAFPGSPAYSSSSRSSSSKARRSLWRSAIKRLSRQHSEAERWDLGSVSSSPSFSPSRSL